jgi:hypothetical protein
VVDERKRDEIDKQLCEYVRTEAAVCMCGCRMRDPMSACDACRIVESLSPSTVENVVERARLCLSGAPVNIRELMLLRYVELVVNVSCTSDAMAYVACLPCCCCRH